MSSRRSRSGGRWSSTVFSRKNRSSRNRPAATSARRSAFVAARCARRRAACLRRAHALELARLQHAQQLRLLRAARDSRSRRGTACRRRRARSGPTRSVFASVNAPLVCPNSSLSNTPSASPPRFTVTIGARRARRRGVQPSRDHFLAGAVLAGDQRVRVRRADPLHETQHRLHRRRFGDELRRARGAQREVLALEPLAAAQRAAEFHLRAQHLQEARRCRTASGCNRARRGAALRPRLRCFPTRSSRSRAASHRDAAAARGDRAPPCRRWCRACSSCPSAARRNRAPRRPRARPAGHRRGLHLVALAAEEQFEGVEDVARRRRRRAGGRRRSAWC